MSLPTDRLIDMLASLGLDWIDTSTIDVVLFEESHIDVLTQEAYPDDVGYESTPGSIKYRVYFKSRLTGEFYWWVITAIGDPVYFDETKAMPVVKQPTDLAKELLEEMTPDDGCGCEAARLLLKELREKFPDAMASVIPDNMDLPVFTVRQDVSLLSPDITKYIEINPEKYDTVFSIIHDRPYEGKSLIYVLVNEKDAPDKCYFFHCDTSRPDKRILKTCTLMVFRAFWKRQESYSRGYTDVFHYVSDRITKAIERYNTVPTVLD